MLQADYKSHQQTMSRFQDTAQKDVVHAESGGEPAKLSDNIMADRSRRMILEHRSVQNHQNEDDF